MIATERKFDPIWLAHGILSIMMQPEEFTSVVTKEFNLGQSYQALFVHDKGITFLPFPSFPCHFHLLSMFSFTVGLTSFEFIGSELFFFHNIQIEKNADVVETLHVFVVSRLMDKSYGSLLLFDPPFFPFLSFLELLLFFTLRRGFPCF